MCFFWEKNHHFILVHLILSNQEEFIAFIYVDDFSIIDNISEYCDSILDASMDTFYKDYAFRWFPPCLDPFLECQCFLNLAVYFTRARSNLILIWSFGPFFYITLFIGMMREKEKRERKEGWGEGKGGRNWSVFNNRENDFPYFIYVVAIISI